MALGFPAGRAIAKTWVSAARTSDQGLRPRMIDHFNEPASRATRWTLFTLRRIEGTPRRELGRPLCPFARSKARKQVMGRRPRRRGYQLRAAPTPLTEQAIAALPCEILFSLVVFLPYVFALVLRV
jgi:hypothetical protein